MPQPVPAVPQIPAGFGPLPADFTLWVTDPFSFLAQPPVFRASRAAAVALSGGFYNLVQFDTIAEDPYGGWSATATGSQPAWSWLCPVGAAGWYEASLSGFTGNQGGTSDQIVAVIYLNGALWGVGPGDWAVSGGDSGANGPVQVPLLPGDYIQMYLFTSVSVSTPTAAGQLPSMELSWVSS